MEKDEIYRNKIALFRYGIIAPLVTNGLGDFKSYNAFFHDASSKTYQDPTGKSITFSEDTLYRYYKAYQKGGFEALKPVRRVDVGVSRKIDEAVKAQIIYWHSEYPKLPATLIYQKLLDNGSITTKDVSLSTITRFLKQVKKDENYTTKEYRRYEKEHINEVWYGDSSVGPYLKIGKEKKKVWIIALIDDASRMIVGIDVFFNDNYVNLMSVIRSAVIKFGKPKTLKFDNGANYRSTQMEILGAHIGTSIHYAPPYTPTGKAKIERWFRSMKDQWMASLNMNDYHSLDELRDSLMEYVQKYNRSPHTSLKNNKSPQQRFYEESNLIIRLDEERIRTSFLIEIERRVSKDNVISIDTVQYEVDYKYAGKRILLRYSPDFSLIYVVDKETGEMEEIHQLNKIANSTGHRHNVRYSNLEVKNND